jgi:hypothetical protein
MARTVVGSSGPCHHVRHPGGDGLDLRGELVPLREEAVGVGEVADVEHGVVVGQVLDQPVRGHLRSGLEAGELVGSVALPLPKECIVICTCCFVIKRENLTSASNFLRVPCRRRPRPAGASPGRGKAVRGRWMACPAPRSRLAARAQFGKNT